MKLSIIIINRDYIVICLKILRITWTEKPKCVTETDRPPDFSHQGTRPDSGEGYGPKTYQVTRR